MHSKTRIAALIAALVFGAQVGIAAMEDAKSVESTQAVEQKTDTLAAAPAAAAEPAAAPAAPEKSAVSSATDAVKSWYGRFVATIGKGVTAPPSVFPEGADGDVHTWLMPTQIAYFEQLEQRRLASLQPQPEAQPAAAQVQAQDGSTNLVAAHEASIAGAIR
jgi:hypothetical protein